MATGDRLPVESRFQQVINLGLPDCYAFIRDAIFAILREYDIAYIKWDHNRDLIDAGTQPAGRPGVHEQTLAFYRLLDEIKAAFPGLEIESCSSGGARVDLGVLERTERVWVSDCIDPLERQEMHRWTTQLIPPELMGAHIASGRVAHHRSAARPRLPGRHGDLRAPGHRVGPVQGLRHRAGRPRRLDRLLQGAPRPAARRRPGPDRLPRRQPERPWGGVAGQEHRDLLAGLGGPIAPGLHGAGAVARPRPRPALPGRAGARTCCPGPVGCRAGGDCGHPRGKRCTPCHRGPDRPCSPMASSESSSAAPRSPAQV